MLNTISSLDARWNSAEMIDHRKDICNKFHDNDGMLSINRKEGDVLSFFEDLGIYLKKGIFDVDIIWDKYSYNIEHYWAMYEPHIKEFRISHNDKTWYDKFQYLHEQMVKVSKSNNLDNYNKTQDQIKKFIKGEV